MGEKQGMILIDSDVLINLFDPLKANHFVADKELSDLLNDKIELFVSIITEIEILQGSKTLVEKNKLQEKLDFFQTLTVTEEISITAKRLIFDYSSSYGLRLGDSLIAATALHFDCHLFTFNLKDFKFIKNLKLYEPS